MAIDIQGETAVCSLEVKSRSSGEYVDPSVSTKITIRHERTGQIVVDSQDMSKDSTGKYHYDYDISAGKGKYKVLYVAINGTRTSKLKDTFTVSEESE